MNKNFVITILCVLSLVFLLMACGASEPDIPDDAALVIVGNVEKEMGWLEETVQDVSYDAARRTVTLQLKEAPRGNLVRLIVKGTGAFPFLGTNFVPLAGAAGGAPGSEFDGNDFVSMFKIRS